MGASPKMQAVKAMIERVAPVDITVLVWGESGVGKELVARALHAASQRRNRPFVKVNCAALPSELLESELFGYERGAFTGASRSKPGKFELADTGTIFLDEIGEIAPSGQAKLLQVLQDREFARLGSLRDTRVDVRVIAATNKNLGELAPQGRFREDLYYRLSAMSIHVPPLRERPEDIPWLSELFLVEFAAQYGRDAPALSPSTLERLARHRWPGNVRELQNAIKRIVVLGSDGFVVHAPAPPGYDDAPAGPAAPEAIPAPHAAAQATGPDDGLGLREIVHRAATGAEAAALRCVLELVRWNRLEAARRLRVSYKTLLVKMKLHGLD